MANIQVEVVFATPETQTLLTLKMPINANVVQAIEASGILEQHPEISLAEHTVGIWSKPCTLTTPLSNHDRVEIYRKITKDPKAARIARTKKPQVTPN